MALKEKRSFGKGGRKEKAKYDHQGGDGVQNVEALAHDAQTQPKKQKRKERELLVQKGLKDVGQHKIHSGGVNLETGKGEERLEKKKKKKDRALALAGQVEGSLGQYPLQTDVATPKLEDVERDVQSQPEKRTKKQKDRGLVPDEGGSGQHKGPENAATPRSETSEQNAHIQLQKRKKKKEKEREQGCVSQGEDVAPLRSEAGVQEEEEPPRKRKKKDRGDTSAGQGEDDLDAHVPPIDVVTSGVEATKQDAQKWPDKKKRRKDRAGQGDGELGGHSKQPDVSTSDREVETIAQDALLIKKKKKPPLPEGHTEGCLETGDVVAQEGEEAVQKTKKKKRRKLLETQQADGGTVSVQLDTDPDKVQSTGKKRKGSIDVILSANRAARWADDEARTDLKYGAFSKEEDERLRAAVAEYIEEHELGDDGVEKLLNTTKHKGLKGAWLEIGRCLPDRSIRRVHARATRLLHEGNYLGRWSPEEEAMLRSLHAQMGSKWSQLGRKIGRLPEACKEKWRILRVVDKRKGHFSPEESQKLARLVHESLAQKRLRKSVERVIDGRQVRDDIDWTPISERMGDRTANQCLHHWYYVLAPPTVRTSGVEIEDWGKEDDRTMLQRIVESGATSEVDVEWGSLLPDRDGATCRKRWRMMVKHLPPGESFEASVITLCERYAPDLLLEAG